MRFVESIEKARAVVDTAQGGARIHRLWSEVLSPQMTFAERRALDRIQPDVDKLAGLAESEASVERIVELVRSGSFTVSEPADCGVTLASVHYAKGRQWKFVFVVNLTEGILPSYRSDDLEEEARIFYTACSRAEEAVYLCAPERFDRASGVSRFVLPLLERYGQ